ncbi:energy transducer TonB [Capnocytophaga genosp. AHN8471]|uniref:Energy transducer TonB n=1 Tax=Capnocytophaga genosp. AHN8471 TaxID=327574 RepID=A0ABS1YXX0_9FLAO|nr:energy transducer TonB [Capnocytophaga genosp. AHN8471]MBM0651264.1 energy transducer TonB [Capnocytophaga genosp. AHN8471]MBM0663345.1 energy transducer TonB [Capnocytophaga genosp. AHN8471]
MQLKKNPKADLAKQSGLFFAIGFAAISGFTLWGFEAKIQNKGNLSYQYAANDKAVIEEDPVAIELPTPEMPQQAPPPPVLTQEIEVVKNDKPVDEVLIGNTDPSDPTPPVLPESIPVVEDENPEIVVPFAVIEDKPLFQECKNVPRSEQMSCFKEHLDKHVKNNFRYPQAALDMGIEGRVNVSFRINTDGTITILGVRGTDRILEDEAKRIISTIPKLIPGKQRNKPTAVTFAYPINFKLSH